MMSVLIALLFAVHPPVIDISGSPGSEVSIPLLLVGDEDVRISGGGVISAEGEETLDGAMHTSVTATISPYARPGLHNSYLYIAPRSEDAVVGASAVTVRTTVTGAMGNAHTVPSTEQAFAHIPLGWMAGTLGVLLIALLAITGAVRIRYR